MRVTHRCSADFESQKKNILHVFSQLCNDAVSSATSRVRAVLYLADIVQGQRDGVLSYAKATHSGSDSDSDSVAAEQSGAVDSLCIGALAIQFGVLSAWDLYDRSIFPSQAAVLRCAKALDQWLAQQTAKCNLQLHDETSIDSSRRELCKQMHASFPTSVVSTIQNVHKLEAGTALESGSFDLCAKGTAASNDWGKFGCAEHLGPCCGNGVCDSQQGETSENCAGDCA